MTVSWSWAVEMYLSAAWTDVTRDVVKAEPVHATRGIQGSGVKDLVALPGMFSFVLDNSQANSGAKLGYYSPGHANCRAGFGKGTRVRLKLVHSGASYYWWHGRIRTIEPMAGQFRERMTFVQAADYMQILSDFQLDKLAIQEDKRFDQLIDTAVDAVSTAPMATSYAVDPSTSEIAFHLEQDERTYIMTVLQKICQSTGGMLFVKGDATGGETLTYESRHTRALRALAGTLNNTMSDMKLRWEEREQYTKVRVLVYPVRTDDSNVVLASLAQEVEIGPLKSYKFNLRVRDPNGSARISGKTLVSPLVADTDYKVSSVSGGGNDKNGSVTVGTPSGSNVISVTITNPDLDASVYVNHLQVRGLGIYPYDSQDQFAGSGDRHFTYEMPYQASLTFAKAYATYLQGATSNDLPIISDVWFYADFSDVLMGYLHGDVEIGSRVLLQEAATGLDMEFFVNFIDLEIVNNGSQAKVGWTLAPAETAQYFILDDTTYGVLDEPTIVLAI